MSESPYKKEHSLLRTDETTSWSEKLIHHFRAKHATVGVIGLGYVGLPLAEALAQAGYQVYGIDTDPAKIDRLRQGESYIADVSSASVASLMETGRLIPTSDYSVVRECCALSICVPTPLRKTGDPDISYIVDALERIVPHLHPGMALVLESTTYPGTTTEVLLPRLEDPERDLKVGETLFLAFSPERVDPGRTDWTTKTTPKVIGGFTPTCLDVITTLYGGVLETLVPVSSPAAAEMTKLLENTFRAVNIGLANEVLLMCDYLDVDVWEVIDAAATKPFGFMKFAPGPGLGGHCIPIDPLYLSWRLRTLNYRARFIELASEINTAMPNYWVLRVQDRLNDVGKPIRGSEILVLGVTYKRDVTDIRESPALDIIHLLLEKGGNVRYHDPYVAKFDSEGIQMERVLDLKTAIDESDCVVIATDHSAYDWHYIRDHARLIVDTRRAIAKT
jgi:UDP-N-acetyl-D-glucosamine dehydrogenase